MKLQLTLASAMAACLLLACIGQPAVAAEPHHPLGNSRGLQGQGGFPDFDASFAQAQAAAQAAASSGGGGGGCYNCGYPDYNQCQAAASAFASAGSGSGGRRRLMDWRDTFSNAFAQANAQAGAGGFGSPGWRNNFINACAARASASASSSSFGGRKLKNYGGKFPNFNSAFSRAQAAAQAAASSGGGGGCYNCGYPGYNQCQAAASAFASAGSGSGGRRLLMDWRDTFSNAFAEANAQAGAGGFGSPGWRNSFINACASQASAGASSSSFGGGK
jgi:hypothetical protein